MRFVALFICVLCFAEIAVSAPSPDDLKRIELQLQQERKTGIEAGQKVSALTSEMKQVQRQLMGSAKTVQEKEKTLETLEDKLTNLNTRQKELEKKLSLNDAQLAKILQGMQTLALRPKEALFLKPMTPIDTVRSHLLMQTSIPALGAMSDTMRNDLAELMQTRSQISTQAKQVKTVAEQLAEKRLKMEKLLKQKSVLQAQYMATHEQAKKRADTLAAQASDLRDLLRKLEVEKRRQQAERAKQEQARQAEAARRQQMVAAGQTPPPAQRAPAYVPAKRVKSGAFAKSKGALLYPVRGRIAKNFGDTTVSGAHIKGMSISTRSGSSVIAPFDGTVLFSGPFKNYGQLLIMDNGDNYLTLLAGMDRIYASAGQEILAGEPVGTMGNTNPSLYIEIRKEGVAIDPKPWFPRT